MFAVFGSAGHEHGIAWPDQGAVSCTGPNNLVAEFRRLRRRAIRPFEQASDLGFDQRGHARRDLGRASANHRQAGVEHRRRGRAARPSRRCCQVRVVLDEHWHLEPFVQHAGQISVRRRPEHVVSRIGTVRRLVGIHHCRPEVSQVDADRRHVLAAGPHDVLAAVRHDALALFVAVVPGGRRGRAADRLSGRRPDRDERVRRCPQWTVRCRFRHPVQLSQGGAGSATQVSAQSDKASTAVCSWWPFFVSTYSMRTGVSS